MNALATITVKTIHTLASHILHNRHNQGIFIEFPGLLQRLLVYKSLSSLALLISILAVLVNCIDTTDIPYTHSFFFYKSGVTSKA